MANPNQEIIYKKLFINNEFVDAQSGKTFVTLNPQTGKPLAEVAEADKADVDLAVKAAKKAFERGSAWRDMDASQRGRLINKLADLIEQHKSALANLEVLDNGKPFAEADFDIQCAIDTFRYYAGWCDKIHGNTIPADGGSLAITSKEPIGVVGQIIPWNYPTLMVSWKWAPALAAGCTIVLKPAEQTPLSALYAAALTKQAGFPSGVINVVPGFGETAGHALVIHPDVRKVAFTGSTEIGRLIAENAAKSNLKKVSLELGGKSPLVVMQDVDLDEAVEIAHNAVFANHGQCCCAGTRTFVQETIYDAFVAKSVELTRKRKVGNPFADDTLQGPQIDAESQQKILKYIELGNKQGAKLECGGNKWGNEGFFVEPTIFSNVTDNMTIAQEEIFGPVQSVIKFKTLDEVIERANKTSYGLAAGILTKNIDWALTFARAVEAGSVWINCYDAVTPQTPFGGYKQSGHGRELGEDGLEPYTETKTILVKLPTKN
ncbi:aldehyde dehydrogenase 1A1-like isoform X2 [Sitodiplosis mosellana]|nr:aldehyde dehydrogenase 1A1-like isoform X2 [Sitodiplosis mosellana]XP_055315288.1 aldehyde dehydrogenase 1A1-like isoform X2 [Sitodiplosis mosellana]